MQYECYREAIFMAGDMEQRGHLSCYYFGCISVCRIRKGIYNRMNNDYREIIDDEVTTTGKNIVDGEKVGNTNDEKTAGGANDGNIVNGANVHSEKDGDRAGEGDSQNSREEQTTDSSHLQVTEDTDSESEYEDFCYICRRPEHVAGKLIKIPNNICICQDCMQKTFNAMNGAGFPMDDMINMGMMGKMPNISMINLSDLQGMIPNNQKIKKKKPKEQTETVIDIHKIPAPHKIKASLDEYVVGQEQAKKVMSVGIQSLQAYCGRPEG